MDLDRFRALPLLGIVRGVDADAIAPLTETAIGAGLGALEVTMNTPGAADAIRRMTAAVRGAIAVGAGTVLTLDELEAALDAGATFIVLPVLVPDVVAACVARAIPVFPGALTPSEIHAAWEAGATMVKVFPAGVFGPGYLREIRGPFRDLEILACGGVTAESLPAYFAAGASAVAFGASVFRAEWLAARSYACIRAEIERLIAAFRAWRASAG